jgi:MFS family permease
MVAAVASSWALFLGIALMMLGNGLQGSLLGIRASLEGFPTTVTGILMSGYYAGFLVGSVLAPKLVARVGHVRVFAALASLASSAILVHVLWIDPASWTLIRLVSGFCYAGLYVVVESWLNDQASNETRGQLLSAYMVVVLGGAAGGQILLNVADPSGAKLFILVSILISLALIPLLLSTGRTPPFEAPSPVGIRQLYRVSPTGVVGYFGTVMANGAYFGMGAVYGREIGLSIRDISVFMSLILLGGMFLQWPIGRLSDAWDRRQVLTGVTFLAAVLAVLASLAAGRSLLGLFALTALFGGTSLPMYSLCIAYTNDYLERDQMVQASGTLVLIGGIGAVFGPTTAAIAMQSFGAAGFFWWLAVIHAVIGVFALYRMTRRAALPRAAQGSYVAVAPRVTQVASALYAEEAGEDDAAGVRDSQRVDAERQTAGAKS